MQLIGSGLTLHNYYTLAGNYRGYYGKRRSGHNPYQGDERLKLIPQEWLQGQRVLDIGCNAGSVTIEIGMDPVVCFYCTIVLVLNSMTGLNDLSSTVPPSPHNGC